jgi:hypothetical protein
MLPQLFSMKHRRVTFAAWLSLITPPLNIASKHHFEEINTAIFL